MEKSATLHYIRPTLAFRSRDCDVAPSKNSPLASKQKIPQSPRTATEIMIDRTPM